jgi:hypothetical protein
MTKEKNLIKQKRLALLSELEDVCRDIEQDTGKRLDRVRQNINIAEDELLNDGEYNYCVQLALHQLSREVVTQGPMSSEIIDRVKELREGVEEKAALPPQDEITRKTARECGIEDSL